MHRLMLLGTLVFSRVIAMLVLHIYDDAFITFRTAENLASGAGFSFNPGEHVMGLTCPAFGLLQSAIAMMGFPLPISIPVLNILMDVGIGYLLIELLKRLREGERLAIIALALFILSPALVRTTVGAMEMNIFMLLSLLSIWLFLERKTHSAIAVASINYFIRPEAVVLVGVLLVCEGIWYSRKNAVMMAAISLMTVAPGLIALQLLYGNFLPQSVTAKATTGNSPIILVLSKLFLSDPVHIALLPLAIIGLLRYLRNKEKVLTILGLWFILYVGAYAIFRPNVWGWYGFAPRLIEIIFAAQGVLYLLDLSILSKLDRFFATKRIVVLAVMVSVLVYTGLLFVAYPSKVTANVYRPMEAWGKDIPPNETILADDIGAIGYYTRSKIYDTFGLVWPEAVGKSVHDLILMTRPDHVVLTAMLKHKQLMDTSIFADDYALRQYWMKTARDTITSLNSLENEWVQEYLVYSRR